MTAKGIEQAEKLAAHFDGVDLPYIFTSTKQRSAETAAPLLRSRPNTISMALSEFDEINAGVCEGMRYSDVRDGMPLEYEARSHNKYGYIYPNGESYAMLKERVARGLRRALFLSGEGTRPSTVPCCRCSCFRGRATCPIPTFRRISITTSPSRSAASCLK